VVVQGGFLPWGKKKRKQKEAAEEKEKRQIQPGRLPSFCESLRGDKTTKREKTKKRGGKWEGVWVFCLSHLPRCQRGTKLQPPGINESGVRIPLGREKRPAERNP